MKLVSQHMYRLELICYGGNMIKPEDIFYAFCGRFFTSPEIDIEAKYKIQQWIYGKDDFYIAMYDRYSMSKTTYYVELKQR